MSSALPGYTEDAPRLIEIWKTVDHGAFLAPVHYLFPASSARVLDVGAGIGIDAAWFAAQGHSVIAVEPVKALRRAAMALQSDTSVRWVDDRLPHLSAVTADEQRFDLVLVSAVWAHLNSEERAAAMPALANLLAANGRLVMSVRDGWTPANRPVFPPAPEDTIRLAEAEGLDLILRTTAQAIQPINKMHGVTWIWLAFEKTPR